MKKMSFIAKVIVAAIVATGVMCVMIMHGASDELCLVVYVLVAFALSALFGVFNEPKKAKYGSIKHKTGYRKAA